MKDLSLTENLLEREPLEIPKVLDVFVDRLAGLCFLRDAGTKARENGKSSADKQMTLMMMMMLVSI